MFERIEGPHSPGSSPEISPRHRQTCWNRWGKRAVELTIWTGGLITSVATRILCADTPVKKSAADLSIGMCLQGVISVLSRKNGKTPAAIHDVSSTVFGYGTGFALTLGSWFTESVEVAEALDSSIIGCAGANLQIMFQKLREHGFRFEREASVLRKDPSKQFQKIFSSQVYLSSKVTASDVLSFFYGGSCIVGSITLQGRYAKLATIGAIYYCAEFIGEKFLILVNRAIEIQDDRRPLLTDDEEGSSARGLQEILNAVFFVAVPSAMPFVTISAPMWQKIVAASLVGFGEGFSHAGIQEQLERLPIRDMPFFQLRPRSTWVQGALALYEIGIFAWLSYFCYFQIQDDLDGETFSKGVLGSFLGSAALERLGTLWIDRVWDPDMRNRVLDWLASNLLVRMRLLKIPPSILFSIVTFNFGMDDVSMEAADTVGKAIATVGWGAFALALGEELNQTAGRRYGAGFLAPNLVLINAAITVARRISGDVP